MASPTDQNQDQVNLHQFNWRPNPGPQEFCLSIPGNCYEILYGGARGGGKTDAGLMWLTKPVAELNNRPLYIHPLYRALVLRRNANDLTDWMDRAERIYRLFGAILKDKNKSPFFLFPSGAKIHLGHLKDEDAYSKYQGHEYQRMLIEELTQIASELLYTKLIASCRSTVPQLRPQILGTTNPGGKGHGWVRRRFVAAGPPNTFFINPGTNRPAIYIPAKIEDNPHLMEADPDYVHQLEGLKTIDEKLYRAWRSGEWDAFEGQVFSEWKYELHTFKKMWVPLEYCYRIASFDWGFRAPASMHWIAKTPENAKGVQHHLIYREIYKSGLTPRQWGELLASINKIDPIQYLVLPHDCFSSDQGQETIAEQFVHEFKKAKQSIHIIRGATLNRGARRNRLGLMHSGLAVSPDLSPYIMVHESCTELIRTLPELPYSDTDIEDVDTDSEDHAYDSASLGIMTLKPKFEGGGLVDMQSVPQSRFAPGWVQTDDGQIVPSGILQALAKPAAKIITDGEF